MAVTCVLVIEDSACTGRLIEHLLSRAGMAVTLAVDAEGALELLRASIPDLILTDVELPGMSGLELTRLLKAEPSKREIPIVALTANDSAGDRQSARDAGCDGYISKPINPSRFAEQIGALTSVTGRLPIIRTGSELETFEASRRIFLLEGARDSELMVRMVEQGATDLGFLDKTLHRWIGCGSPAGLPEISYRARTMRDLISPNSLDLPALAEAAQALRQIFHQQLAAGMVSAK